jgi:hypothetical protein
LRRKVKQYLKPLAAVDVGMSFGLSTDWAAHQPPGSIKRVQKMAHENKMAHEKMAYEIGWVPSRKGMADPIDFS